MCAFNDSFSEISDKCGTPAADHHLLLSWLKTSSQLLLLLPRFKPGNICVLMLDGLKKIKSQFNKEPNLPLGCLLPN